VETGEPKHSAQAWIVGLANFQRNPWFREANETVWEGKWEINAFDRTG
jgi:hypothetical protein